MLKECNYDYYSVHKYFRNSRKSIRFDFSTDLVKTLLFTHVIRTASYYFRYGNIEALDLGVRGGAGNLKFTAVLAVKIITSNFVETKG